MSAVLLCYLTQVTHTHTKRIESIVVFGQKIHWNEKRAEFSTNHKNGELESWLILLYLGNKSTYAINRDETIAFALRFWLVTRWFETRLAQ